MGEVWVATHQADAQPPTPISFSLLRAEEIRTVCMTTRNDIPVAVAAMVQGPGLDGQGQSTVLVSRHGSTNAGDSPPLPALFHLDLVQSLHQAASLDEAAPLYVRAEFEEGTWSWKVYTYARLHERISMENLTAENR
ncbi:hypothetical protein ACODT3_40835 [Streptomyces sp. 4.24]|uniref:hypothetical protein n=1 Tax=Streptomyces tritrimontium TaxID=3406573 RepID=UPI003BB63C2A